MRIFRHALWQGRTTSIKEDGALPKYTSGSVQRRTDTRKMVERGEAEVTVVSCVTS